MISISCVRLLVFLQVFFALSNAEYDPILQEALEVKDRLDLHSNSNPETSHLSARRMLLRFSDHITGRQGAHIDVGEPLILTPYIENGDLEEGRKMSAVPPFAGKVKSYAGFITVNKAFQSNLYFWYFESESRDADAPLVVWLQGGPGGSSLFGLFAENGPYIVENQLVSLRKTYWSQHFHVIYIDNPVGTGFSFATEDGYAQNQTVVGRDLYQFMLQFLTLFPDLRDNKFYITGESYAGKYIPAFAHTIHEENQRNDNMKINLRGLFIGNGWTDPGNMLKYDEYLYQLGLLDSNAKDEISEKQRTAIKLIEEERYEEASSAITRVLGSFSLHTHLGVYNYVDETMIDLDGKFLNSELFRKSAHVGNLTFSQFSELVHSYLYADMAKSVIDWVVELLDHYPIVFYNGQLDIICAYPLTEHMLKTMKWDLSEEWKSAERHRFEVEGQVAGYYKQAGNLTELMIRNAGHMVPTDQPEWALRMLLDFMDK